ncbi:hypothetical protein ACFY8P_21485 [Streptomyces sp. NPDC012693]|uniref:hypothetical protein n=1 Tax=Streptomyces sp. NPDC012693 TaxID=3364844 RepID=UPI0036C860C2
MLLVGRPAAALRAKWPAVAGLLLFASGGRRPARERPGPRRGAATTASGPAVVAPLAERPAVLLGLVLAQGALSFAVGGP